MMFDPVQKERHALIKVRSFATLRDALGGDEVNLTIEGRKSLSDVLLRLEEIYGEAVKSQLRDGISGEYIPFLVMLNNQTIPISQRSVIYVKDGDCVTIFLPFDGG